jgi:hypothetical protein
VDRLSVEEVLRRSEEAFYMAKRDGRNRAHGIPDEAQSAGHKRTTMTLYRRAGIAKLCTSLAISDDRGNAVYDWLDRSESATLSLAIICKSARAPPSAAAVRSDFSKRRFRRSFSATTRLFSGASGFAGRPRLRLLTVAVPLRYVSAR